MTSPYGTVTGRGWYDEGVQVTSSVYPSMVPGNSNTRYIHTGWSESLPITITGPKTITATWKTQYYLQVQVTGSGLVSPSNGWFDEGTSVILTPSPSGPEWWFDSFSIPSPVVMDTAKQVFAYFARQPVTLSTSVSPPGAGSVSPRSGLFSQGILVTLTAIPTSGWYFSSWSGDTSDIQNSVIVIMNTNKTVAAIFTRTPLMVSPARPKPLAITMDTTEPPLMSMVIVSGANWAPGKTVNLKIFKPGAATPSTSRSIVPRDDGSFAAILTLPSDLEANVTNRLVAADAQGNTADVMFKPTSAPGIAVLPYAAAWGVTINITGRGFLPLSEVRCRIPGEGNIANYVCLQRTTDSAGSFFASFPMPFFRGGITTIGVTDGINVAIAYIDVLESPGSQFRY